PLQTKSGAFLARQAAKYAADSAYQLSRMKRLPGLANGITSVLKRNAYIQGEVAKPVAEFLKKIPGKGNAASKAAAAGSTLGGLIAIGGVAIVVAIQAILQGIINSSTFKNFDYVNGELQKSFDRYQKNVIAIRGVEAQVKQFKQEDQRTRDRIYAIEKQQPKIREDANNALYETRQGRKIVEGKIAQANKEVATLKSQFEKLLGNANSNFQKTIETTVNNLQKALEKANNEITKANNEVNKANNQVKDINSKLTAVEKSINVVKNLPQATATAITTIQTGMLRAVDETNKVVQQATRRWGVTVTPATVTPATVTVSDQSGLKVTPVTVTPARVTYSDFSSSDIGDMVREQQRRDKETLEREISALGGGVTVVAAEAKQARLTALEALAEAKKKAFVDITPLQREIDKVKADIKADEVKFGSQIKEIERVNAEGNRKLDQFNGKLDQIIPMLGLIPGKVATTIKPNLLTAPQVEAATGNAICKSLNGGCGKASVDYAVNRINQQNNNNTGSVLDAVNTGANAALLTGQQTILSRLGDQLPGGIGGKLSRFSDWLKLDRALNLLTTAATVHNAFMLSNDIGQTLLGIISNILQLVGLKDDNGQAFDIGSVISSTIENFIKSMVGAENYQTITVVWAKANRIYQASVNILNAFQSLASTILTGLEMTAGKVAKIGNALRKSGEVLESAYGWMNPQPKFNRVTQFLENLQNGASTIQMVTQAPLDIINATTELTTATTELTNAIKEDGTPANKGKDSPEPEQLKAVETASKLASSALEMIDLDLEADE
ncbi:hypothetical protein, partial [Anabaena sp. CCY 9402-a]|uniref:hypothetical protein n=1 Tax=Anabaena sp. CCY 9402-a TaxID=3103867 RepID=UPI0039C5ED8C